MARFRQRWKRTQKTTSTMVKTSSGSPLTINVVTHVDTAFESMLDGSITKVPMRRPTLSDSVRTIKRPERYKKWKFHDLQYTSQDKAEQIIPWTSADSAGGARKWSGTGNLTQFHAAQAGRALPSWPSIVGSPLLACTIEATSKALNYLDRPKLALGEPIAELRTLPRDLNPTLNALERNTRRYKNLANSGRFGRGKRNARYVATAWASYAFFIGPLIRTAEDVAEEYAAKIDVKDLWQTARGISKKSSPHAFKTTTASGSGWTWTWEQQRWLEIEYQRGILYSSPDRTTSVPGRLGLVSRDWPVVAWELMPLSFIIDRVINVKRFLKTSIALSSPKVRISRDSFESIRQVDVKLARIRNISSPSVPQAHYTPATSPWFRQEDFQLLRYRWWPDLGDVVSTARGSGLANSLTKMADVASLVVSHLT